MKNAVIGTAISICLLLSATGVATAGTVLIYGPSLGTQAINEQTLAVSAGHTVSVAGSTAWSAMTAAQFASYDAIVFGDRGCEGSWNPSAANANKGVWSPAITGNSVVMGLDPAAEHSVGPASADAGHLLVTNAINFAASGGGTGLYVSFGCGTSPQFLSQIGNFQTVPVYGNEVNMTDATHPVVRNVSGSSLSTWDYSVHQYITSYPSNYVMVAADAQGAAVIVATASMELVEVSPRTGSAAGGQAVTLNGTNFLSGASVMFGSSDASDEWVSTSNEMTATTPALTAATLYSTKVTNYDGTTVTRPRSYFADFSDVQPSTTFHDFIVTLAVNRVTVGCGRGIYCPAGNVDRVQMAIFISRSAAGGDANVPVSGMVGSTPYACGTGGTSAFGDVAPTHTFCKQIHYVASRGIMPGCTGAEFCTTPLVPRDQLAGFIARAIVKGGEANVPAAFTDVTTGRSYDLNAANVHFADMADNAYTRHAHYIWARGIIDGCSGSAFCPSPLVNRGQMAKFLVNGFGLTWP